MSGSKANHGYVRLSPTLHLTIGMIVAVFVVMIIFACIFRIEVIARAPAGSCP